MYATVSSVCFAVLGSVARHAGLASLSVIVMILVTIIILGLLSIRFYRNTLLICAASSSFASIVIGDVLFCSANTSVAQVRDYTFLFLCFVIALLCGWIAGRYHDNLLTKK